MLDITDKKYFSWQITERFLLAMDGILGSRSKGKTTAKLFGDIVGIASSNLNRIRQTPTEHFVTIEACGRLCNYYKISASWLVLGIGNRYHNDELFAAYQTLTERVSDIEKSLSEMQVAIEIITRNKRQ